MKENGADITIGRTGLKEKGLLSSQELFDAGADYVTTDLGDLIKIPLV